MSYDIFLSYRRKDADGHSNVGTARTFKYEFENHQYEVFFDYKDCTDEYFKEIILPAIRTCRYFVLVLTRGCLERCKDEDDWLRREIKEAIDYGRKIIPITPDGEFGAWPKAIPESIKDLDGLQITTIHTDSIFEDNMAQLIRNRMNPPQRRKAEGMENYPKLKVRSNLDCFMFVDDEKEARAKILANKLEKIPLKPSEYELKFVSVENAEDYITDDLDMPDKDKLYTVDLLTLKQERELEARVEFDVNGVNYKMVKVVGGTFMMGATVEQGGDALSCEKPEHMVTLRDYYIGETVVTQALWKAVMGNNPSEFKGVDFLPVERVSWDDVKEFIKKLNEETGKVFRLPTEAEWEFAARGGVMSKEYKYSGSNEIDEVAWYADNSKGKVHAVKGKNANELGLYDMSGNVWEWCSDWYGGYSKDAQNNPQGPSTGDYRVTRGGGCLNSSRFCRVTCRKDTKLGDRSSYCGFRLALCP